MSEEPHAPHQPIEPDWPRLDPPTTYLKFPLAPHQLAAPVTPVGDLFVLAHLGVPRLDREAWSLEIGGLVARPMTLRMQDIEALPRRHVEAFLQCAGNPATPTVPARLVANVHWRGVSLAAVLDAAGILPEARFVWTYGLDRGGFMGAAAGRYLKDLPVERARSADVLIALELNGAPLTPEHGYPARLVVPGFYGTNSVKWLYRIELARERAQGLFTTTLYNDPIESTGPEPRSRPVWNVAAESVIVSPGPGTEIRSSGTGAVEVWGWAWGDADIAQVEVSFDGGHEWSAARLEPRRERAWQRFSAAWSPRVAGPAELQCRATDASGRTQPRTGARNAIHGVTVTVRDAP
ncbi:MAG: molybdopterin-dependent oxidoreductase [Steroidobacteraceae bacterium]